ncbi:ATP12 family chaperone protein [Tropicibacter naphthalenivorans]|uniref:ATP12 chaperone protein n=1 Tax=Tropicibacter naphthalenivorans TaxID=441103 RepID=A0A0P1GBS0_9RHOB|nr:ATP12 family protein [Tropicibacter naphthalenivorans]CUH78813.1 ATP12 chaperone protein [Tropicibacter naphthalenivorans]SMC81648.1 Chaperone required for the assembly of the F1-ATPase [Tropicibacter naphthalenivorans]
MSEWAPKRFWKTTEVAPVDAGFTVLLDGRGIKTPAKTPIHVPTEGLARALATEWDAQEDKVNPATMPYTRTTNSALDKVATQHAEVADMLAAYGDSDLLCYRADHPEELVQRQALLWDPMLDWLDQTFAVRLTPVAGVIHAPQDPAGQATLTREVHALSPFQLAAFHDLVAMSGSLVLALAAARGAADLEELWELSRLDELWQEEQWGKDEEAQAKAEYKRGEFLHAGRYFALATAQG